MIVRKRSVAFAILVLAVALGIVYLTGRTRLGSGQLALDGIQLSEVHPAPLKTIPKPTVCRTAARTPEKQPVQQTGRTRRTQPVPERSVEPAPLARLRFPAPVKRHTEFALQPVPTPRLVRSPEIVRAIVAGASLRIRELYRRQLRVDPELRGELRVRFLVEPLGRVREVQVLGGSLSGTEFGEAVVQVLQQMVFPTEPSTGEIEAYRQTFVFQPKS